MLLTLKLTLTGEQTRRRSLPAHGTSATAARTGTPLCLWYGMVEVSGTLFSLANHLSSMKGEPYKGWEWFFRTNNYEWLKFDIIVRSPRPRPRPCLRF